MTLLTFALNYAVGGTDTFGYHVVNIFIHVVSGCLVILLFRLLLRSCGEAGTPTYSLLPLVAALVFTVHPVETQAVTYLSQRFASLAAMFYLLTVVLYLKARFRVGEEGRLFSSAYYWLALFSALLAVKSKEISFTIPFMLVLCEFFFFKGSGFKGAGGALRGLVKKLPALVPFLLVSAIIPYSIFGFESSVGEALVTSETRVAQVFDIASMSSYDYFVTQIRVMLTYIRLLFFPVGLRLEYEYLMYGSFFELPVVASFVVLLFIASFAVYLYRKADSYLISRLVPFGVAWFFLALSVESTFIPIRDVIFEHRLYLPSVGAVVAFVSAAWWGLGRVFTGEGGGRRAAALLVVLVVTPLFTATYLRNAVWSDSIVFWEDLVSKSPGKARVRNNLGLAYYERGMVAEAIEEYELAIEMGHAMAGTYFNLGVAYYNLADYEKSIGLYKEALKLNPRYVEARANLGGAYVKGGFLDDALVELKEVVLSEPELSKARNYLGMAYVELGRLDEAAAEFKWAVSLGEGVDATYNLGVTYLRLGLIAEALNSFEETLRLDPGHAGARSNLGAVYAGTGRLMEALGELTRAVELDPELVEARNNLGNVYVMLGRVDDAVREYEHVVSLAPDHAGAYFNLALMYMRKGRAGDAMRAFERVLELRPGDEGARRMLKSL